MEFSKENSFSFAEDINWKRSGFSQSGDQPVVCVSYFDALAYADWLSEKTGETYRLPSEAEWEYAARAGADTPYHWGTDATKACDYANVRSEGAYTISKRQAEADLKGFPCDDGFQQSSPVGSFAPNEFGLYDAQGNAWEWVADCNHKDYEGAPIDGSTWTDEKECRFAVIRSGSYLNLVERSSTTVRAGRPKTGGATNMGFRIARGGEQVAADLDYQSPDALDPNITNEGGRLFNENCAACHDQRTAYTGIYGKDQESLENAIRNGGNNVMSMPAFADRLTDAEISKIVAYLRELNGWR